MVGRHSPRWREPAVTRGYHQPPKLLSSELPAILALLDKLSRTQAARVLNVSRETLWRFLCREGVKGGKPGPRRGGGLDQHQLSPARRGEVLVALRRSSTIREAAAELGVHGATLWRYLARHALRRVPHDGPGLLYLVRPAAPAR